MCELNVLVLEDEPFQRLLAVTALKRMIDGHIYEAASGKEAVALLDICEPVDIAICDLQMAGVDGLAFLRHASLSGKVRSVVICSEIEPTLRQATTSMIKCLGLRFLGDLGKPFSLERMRELLSIYQGETQQNDSLLDVAELPSVDEVVNGLDNYEFEAYYQPKVVMESNALVGAEVLVRWNHPALGILPPSHFLYVMESYNLIDRLFWQLLNQGLSFIRTLVDSGLSINLAFNLQPAQLGSRMLANNISAALQRHGVSPRLVTFEITETGFIGTPASSLENLVRLRMMGCGLAMDDFGAGYSSLQRLSDLPFTEIKLDRAFVTNMTKQPKNYAVISSAVALAKALGVSLIVEGVETVEQKQRLLALGCSLAQGFLFARPMSGHHFNDYCMATERSQGGGERSIINA